MKWVVQLPMPVKGCTHILVNSFLQRPDVDIRMEFVAGHVINGTFVQDTEILPAPKLLSGHRLTHFLNLETAKPEAIIDADMGVVVSPRAFARYVWTLDAVSRGLIPDPWPNWETPPEENPGDSDPEFVQDDFEPNAFEDE